MIEIKHLQTLQILHDTGSITKTAIFLHKTQSALSHQINKLEKKLGFTLFIRKSNPLKFSLQGKMILELSKRLLPDIKNTIQNCKKLEMKKINIAIECHNCIQWLIPTFNSFQKKWPNFSIQFNPNINFYPQSELIKGKIDLVFTSDIIPSSNLFYIPIFDFEIKLVLSPKHKLNIKKKNILPEDLDSEIFIVYPVDKKKLDIWNYFLKNNKINAKFKNVSSTLLIIQMVEANMGISALPSWVTNSFEKQGIIITKRIGLGLWKRLYAAIRHESKNFFIIHEFINYVKLHNYEKLKIYKN